MRTKCGITIASVSLYVLSLLLGVGFFLAVFQVVDINITQDVSKTLPYSLYVDSMGVEDVSDAVINKNQDFFRLKTTLDKGSYTIDYNDLILIFSINDRQYRYEYGESRTEDTFVVEPVLKSQNDTILRPDDKIHILFNSPQRFDGGEEVLIRIKERGTNTPLKYRVSFPKDLYGEFMVLR